MTMKAAMCAKCRAHKCWHPDRKIEFPDFCPHQNYADVREQTVKEGWTVLDLRKRNLACEEVLDDGYKDSGYEWCRVREIMEYSKKLRYKKLGVAFCVGLADEAQILDNILEKNGFEVVSVACMAGASTKEAVGLRRIEHRGQMLCNPLMQAEVLNRETTDLNIMLGLCVGHDILFLKKSSADVTPLIVKDRVMAHNPAGALYTSKGYYLKKLYPK